MINLGISNIVTAFKEVVIGTKILNHDKFKELVIEAIQNFTWGEESFPGQAVIDLPEKACNLVSSGVGRRTMNPDDYVIRKHREKVRLYLKRDHAEECSNVRVVIYTLDAYLDDPDVDMREANRIIANGFTHMLVAVLGSSGPKSPLTPGRFVHNLAGGNNEALAWTAEEIQKKAKEIKNYYDTWCTIAD